jgi:hypothetical protein
VSQYIAAQVLLLHLGYWGRPVTYSYMIRASYMITITRDFSAHYMGFECSSPLTHRLKIGPRGGARAPVRESEISSHNHARMGHSGGGDREE